MDLQSMYANGMGSMASWMAGSQFADQTAANAQDIQAKKLANQQSAIMNPLNAQFKQGEINQQAAQLPGIQGQSMTQQAQGQFDQATNPAKIAEKLASYGTSLGDEGMKRMGQDGERTLAMVQMMAKYPPAMHAKILEEFTKQYGGSLDSPLVKPLLQGPPEQIMPNLKDIGEGMALASRSYLQNKSLAEGAQASHERATASTNQMHRDVATGNNTTQIEVAKIQAKAKTDAANSRSQAAMSHMNMDQKITYLSGIPESERTSDEQLQLVQLSKQRLTEKAAGANAVPSSVLNQPSPTANAANAGANIFNNPGAATPTPSSVPDGYKQIGTSGGKPVYEDSKGNRFIGK